jgi:preprotein translocase subunit SecF
MFKPLHLVPPDVDIDFMRFHRPLFMLSVVMVVGSILLIAFKGLNFGIDFRGGILMEVRSGQAIDLAQMRSQLSSLGLGDVALQEFGSPNDVLVRIENPGGDAQTQAAVVEKVKSALGAGYDYRRTEFVGPKVGSELIRSAVWGVLIAMLGIMAYIWFRYECSSQSMPSWRCCTTPSRLSDCSRCWGCSSTSPAWRRCSPSPAIR